ncbi:MAG: cysteine hydrolase [Nocardioides sp.]|nr:cysteine hydrolase [Nocardioides sp.]
MLRMRATHDALLLIDLQEDYFVDDELERCRDDVLDTCSELARAAHRAGVPVLEVRTEHEPDRSTWTLTMLEDDQGVVVRGTPGAARAEGLDPGPADLLLKTRDSAFFGTDLVERLRRLEVGRLVLTGVSTESCIAATARDAFAHDLAVVLVSEGTASVSWEEHDHTLEMLKTQHRQDVLTAREVAAQWTSGHD